MSVRGAIKKEQFVSLKIFVHNQTKVFNFDISTLVETVLQAVYDSSPPEITSSPLSEYGLFVPNQRGRKPRWLLKSISLDAADCNSQDPLEFKKKLRPMRVMTVDGNVKMIYIDDSAVVRDIADAVGDKLGVKALEEFSLRKKTPAGMAKAPKWLSETQTLHDNDVTADETLEYAKKYYFSDDRVDQEDPFTLHLLYVDAQQSILTGRYPTSRANIVEFAGLQLQIQFGDHKPGTHTEKFFDKRTLIPAKWLAEDKKTPLLPEIINAHKRFVGIKETNAKYRYVTKVRSLPTYGITFFECTQVKEKTGDKKKDKEEPVPFLLGVSRSCLIRMETETQKETNSWPIECIKRWSQTKGTFSIDFGDWEGDYFNFQTPESEALSALIYGYIEIIMRSRNDIGNVREDDDYYDVAEVESVKPIFGFGQDGVTAGYTQGYAATSQIPLHTPTGQFQNFNFPEFSRLVHQDTKELYGKAMMGSDGTQLTPKELAARQMLQKGGARPDNSPVPKSNPQPKQDYEPKLREMLNRVINQMDTLVDTMSQNSFPPILDQYKNILENDLQGLFNCLEGIQQDPDQQVALSHMVRATKPITDCIGDILELLAESETVLIDTYRDDIFDQIKCYWDAAKSSVLNDPALVDSPTIELINLASLQVAEKFSNLLDSLEQMIAVPPDHMLLEESNYILAEIGKCRMINKMVNCNNMRLCQYFLDPDVNQAFVQMTEIVEHSKNTVIDFFDRSSFNDGNNNIHEIGREIDFDIDKLKFIVACADPQRPTGPDGNPLDYGETPEQVAAFKLRMAAKVNAASVLKLLNASENALRNCSDPNVANELWNAIQKGQGALMDLFVVMNQPVTPENPNALLNVAREQIPIFQELARVAKKATPLITDATKKSELSGACQKMNRDLGYLFQNVQEVYNMSLGTEVNNPNAPQGASKVGQLRGAPLSNSQSGAQLSQASQQQINEEALAAKRELKKQAKVFIPKEEMQVAYQHIAKAKQILEEKNVDRVALAKQEAADAMFQTANRRRQVNFKMATESLSTSLKTMQATSNQLANVAAKNPAGCPVIMKMLSSSIEQVLQNALKAAASTDRPVSDQIIESAHFIADATQDLLMAVEAEANNKTPETTRELEQRKLIVNDAVNKLNQLLGISSEIRLPEVEKSLNDLKESMDFYSGGPAGLQGAGRLQGSVKLSGPQGSMLFSHNQPVCEFSVELKELAGIVAGITKSARSSTINHGAHAREATAILQKLLQSAAKVESDSVYSALTSDKDELFQLFDQIHNSSDQFVVLENMKKVNNTVQKLIVYGKEAAKKETDKGRQGQIIQNIQQLMTGFQNLQQSAAQTSTRGPADVSQIKQNVADLVATLLQNNASQSVSESDLVCDPLLAADISKATKALAQTTHDMLAASIKVAQNPQDMTTTQTFEASTKDVVNSLLELKKLTNGLDSGLKECAKAVNKIQTETSYILNDPRFQNDPNAYASLIDTSPQRRAQSAALQAQAVTTLSQVEKQLQGLCGHLLQSETPLIGDQQQVDLKALAQSLSGLVPSFVGSINEIITAQEDSNFRKNLVGNTRQLVQITEDLLKYSQTDYRNLTAEDLQRIAQLKIRAQESAGIVASELKIADTINQEIDKESQIIRGAIEKLLQPIHLVPQGQGGPQGPGQVRVVQGQGTNQRVSMSQGVNTNSQRMPPNAVPLGQNSNQPRMSVGPNGQPIQQGGQGFPRPSVGQGQGTNSQRIVQQGQNPNQQGGQGQLTSPRQGQPGNPQNPQQGQPRPSVGPNGQPINQGPTSPRGPQQGGPQGQPVRVQGQPGNPQNPQQGTNTQQRVVQGQPQGGQQQGLNTLQRLMTNVQPGKGPAPNANPAQGGPKMQHPQKLKPPQTYAEWKGVNLAAQREIVKATQFLQTCDKRNVESMTFAIRKQKAVLLSLVESARQCAALVKDENEKRELLNNAKVVCANVDSIFQDLKQASCGFDVQQNVNTKLNNINDGIAALLQSINRCEPEKPVIVEETITETLTIEESKEFQEFITYLKGKVNGFYADQKPSRFSRDSCDDLFNTCKDVAKMLTKVLYTTKKDLTTLNTDAKPLIEKLFQLANSFHSHYHQHPLAAEFKQQVGQTVLQFSTALESVANAKGNERKEIEAAVQESIKNLTGIVGFITKISPKFSQEHADAERLMEEANRRVMAGAQGKSALEIKMEEELRQEREHQIRVIKIEKELQKEKDRALAEKKARFEAQQGGQ